VRPKETTGPSSSGEVPGSRLSPQGPFPPRIFFSKQSQKRFRTCDFRHRLVRPSNLGKPLASRKLTPESSLPSAPSPVSFFTTFKHLWNKIPQIDRCTGLTDGILSLRISALSALHDVILYSPSSSTPPSLFPIGAPTRSMAPPTSFPCYGGMTTPFSPSPFMMSMPLPLKSLKLDVIGARLGAFRDIAPWANFFSHLLRL